MTPLQICQYARGIYDPVPSGMFDKVSTIGCVVFGHAKVGDVDVIALRGSENIDDWMHDFTAIPQWHSQLGFCHAGFLHDMDDVFSTVRAEVGPNLIITGHSLGGARARILAGLFAVNKILVAELGVFGSPKPAFANLARIIAKSGMKHWSLRFYNDAVVLVPLDIEPFLEFVHTEPYAPLAGHSGQSDMGPLRDHSIDNYILALT
jgi:hypothetical protein